MEFTFYDYLDEAGTNVIREWRDALPVAVKAKFTNALLHLEGARPGDWKRPLVDTLTEGECQGLFEVRRKLSRIQYRLLGCHGPGQRQPTLLHGFIKPGNRVPEAECREAHRRRNAVEADPQKRRTLHDYG